tara:strand:- start:144 stop:731 length:588 start_codon:yes stop_codon:yes gene_type:complete
MNTSSLESLPTDPSISQTTTAVTQISNQGNPNITLETSEKLNNTNETINSQFEKELKMAVDSGNTALPSRDIPNNTTNLTNDSQIQPNYIPSSGVDQDFVQNYENSNDFLNYREKESNREDNYDFFYEQLKIPILIAFLFFIFQLPFTKNFFLKHSPVLFGTDGNYNIYGYTGTSIAFGLLYFVITYILEYYSDI